MRRRLLALVGGGLVVWSFVYLALRRSLELLLLCFRRRPRRSRSGVTPRALRCCTAGIHGPPAAQGPRAAGGAQPGRSHRFAGRCFWCGPRRCCAGTAPGEPALDLPDHLYLSRRLAALSSPPTRPSCGRRCGRWPARRCLAQRDPPADRRVRRGPACRPRPPSGSPRSRPGAGDPRAGRARPVQRRDRRAPAPEPRPPSRPTSAGSWPGSASTTAPSSSATTSAAWSAPARPSCHRRLPAW